MSSFFFTPSIIINDASNIGSASDTDAISIAANGVVTLSQNLVIKDTGTIGSASDPDAISIAANGVVTFTQSPVFPDGSIAVADLDIDGATDIGADLVDADLFIVDDGAGGTNRKCEMSRLKTYIGAVSLSDANVFTGNNEFQGKFMIDIDTINVGSSGGTLSASKSVILFNKTDTGDKTYIVNDSSASEGQIIHIFFKKSGSGANNLILDFGSGTDNSSNILYSGSGLVRYITFSAQGQSASIIKLATNQYQIINAGASISVYS